MIARRNNGILMCLVYIICFIFTIGISTLFSKIIFNVNIHSKVMHEDYQKIAQEEFTITAQKIKFPTKSDFMELEKLNDEILSNMSNTQKLSEQIRILYDEVQNAIVCSTTNKYFNLLEENFNLYQEQISIIQEQISLFEEQYALCLDLISNIPEFSALHEEMYNEFAEEFEDKYEFILAQSKLYPKEKEELLNYFLESKQLANDLFEEYFDLMCHIVYAEAGICPEMEQCYVANVIENRIKHWYYPDNIYDVVYQSGQYTPVSSGSINNTPSEEVIQVVSDYLHGYIDTGMPDDVVFQSKDIQGNSRIVWQHMKSGHYFCYF